MTVVSARELRANLSQYLRRLEGGERFTVTRRGKVLGTIEPQAAAESDSEAAIWKMVREGKASWSGKRFVPPTQGVPLIGEGPLPSEMIIEDRG